MLLDVCFVLAFVVIGMHEHHDGDTPAGIWHTAWPFLAGLAIGLWAVRFWRRPAAMRPAGQGTAPAFIGVAFAFLALFLLGWRAIASYHRIITGP